MMNNVINSPTPSLSPLWQNLLRTPLYPCMSVSYPCVFVHVCAIQYTPQKRCCLWIQRQTLCLMMVCGGLLFHVKLVNSDINKCLSWCWDHVVGIGSHVVKLNDNNKHMTVCNGVIMETVFPPWLENSSPLLLLLIIIIGHSFRVIAFVLLHSCHWLYFSDFKGGDEKMARKKTQ